jgi:hypothetical protein
MSASGSVLESPEFLELVPKAREYVERKGIDWCVAAIVDGSAGYYWYDTAKRLIENVLRGSNWNIYALYKLLNGDARLFKKRVGANNAYLDIRFREVLKSPKEIFDKNVYEYLMTAVVLCDIAVN